MSSPLDAIAAKLAAGERPGDADADALAATPDLVTLGMLADEDRQRRHGRRVTYVRVADLDVTDRAALEAGPPPAAREVRLSGRPASVAEAVEAVRAAARRAAGRPLTGFALEDLVALAAGESAPLETVAARLREAGLEAVAGVSVELAGVEDAITAARAGGLHVWRLHVSRPDPARLATLGRAAAIQQATGGLRAFAPLAAAPDPDVPTTGYDDVKQVALARLLVDNIASIQVDWRGYGPKLAQVALTFGADDVDGVSPLDARDLGARRATVEEIHRNIRAASLEAVERDGRFAPVEA